MEIRMRGLFLGKSRQKPILVRLARGEIDDNALLT